MLRKSEKKPQKKQELHLRFVNVNAHDRTSKKKKRLVRKDQKTCKYKKKTENVAYQVGLLGESLSKHLSKKNIRAHKTKVEMLGHNPQQHAWEN